MTEAKDTVMSKEQISAAKKGHTAIIESHPSVFEDDYAIAQTQAEITGKIMYEEGIKAGRKAFVKWLERYSRRWQGISMNDQLAGREPTKMITIEIEEQVWQRQI